MSGPRSVSACLLIHFNGVPVEDPFTSANCRFLLARYLQSRYKQRRTHHEWSDVSEIADGP